MEPLENVTIQTVAANIPPIRLDYRMKELPATRQSLLDQLAVQDYEAWTEFLKIYGRAVYDYCRSRGLQDADANDVCQEVLSAVEKHLKAGRHDSKKGRFRSWMFRVARNIAIDYAKAKKKQITGGGDSFAARALSEVPEAEQAQSSAFQLEYRRHLFHWAAERVRSCVNESTWQSFWMTAVDGRSPEQVASELQMKTGAVYTAKCRVIARFREVISEFSIDNTEHNTSFE